MALANAVLRDAREKFDTVEDCRPAIERMYRGAREACGEVAAHAERQGRGGVLPPSMRRMLGGKGAGIGPRVGGDGGGGGVVGTTTYASTTTATSPLTEQELYAGADSMEIVRDAHAYFSRHLEWRSARDVMSDLEAVHRTGADAMGLLVVGHLTGAGAAVRRKVEGARSTSGIVRAGGASAGGRTDTTTTTTATKAYAMTAAERAEESAASARDRLTDALLNRDLMKSVGEYEEYLPLSTRVVRELRAIFECLGGMASDGNGLILGSRAMPPTSQSRTPDPEPSLPPGGRVLRTEKVGSGHYSKLTTMRELTTGYPHLDSYGEARMSVAYASVDGYCRQLRNARKDGSRAPNGPDGGGVGGGVTALAYPQNVDAAARDAVRCIEHTMVVISGEKSVYRCVVAPSSAVQSSRGDDADKLTAALEQSRRRSAVFDIVTNGVPVDIEVDAG